MNGIPVAKFESMPIAEKDGMRQNYAETFNTTIDRVGWREQKNRRGKAMFLFLKKRPKCTCPTTCDCQDYENGFTSNECPVHNDYPHPSATCPIHGNDGYKPVEPVFTNCNICGIKLRTNDEHQMGMCDRCAAE